MTTPTELDQVRERVRGRYAQAASTVTAGPKHLFHEVRSSPGIAGYRIVDRRRRFLLRQTCTAR
jgi:hypothetical protein